MKRLLSAVFLVLLLAGLMQAVGTPAGTVIENWATAHYKGSAGIRDYTSQSDTTWIIMAFTGAVEIEPDTIENTGFLECEVYYPHKLKNHGNGDDSLHVEAVSAHGWTTTVYTDPEYDGVPNVPYNNNVVPEDDSLGIVIGVTVGADDSLWGALDTMVVVVSSMRSPTPVSDTAWDITMVVGPHLTLDLSVTPESPDEFVAFDTLDYGLWVTNAEGDSARAAGNVFLSAARPMGTAFLDPASPTRPAVYPGGFSLQYRIIGSPWSATYDADADSIRFRITVPSTDSIAIADSLYFQWFAVADSCLPDTNQVSVYVRADYEDGVCGHAYLGYSDTVTTDVQFADVSITDFEVTADGDISDTLLFPFTITNLGDRPDVFTIELDTLIEGYAWADWRVYRETSVDSALDAGEISAGPITETTELAAGASEYIVVFVTVPDDVNFNDTTLVRVRSMDNRCVNDSAFAYAHMTAPLIRINMNIVEDELDDGNDTLFSYPDSFVTYRIKIWNIGDGEADSFFVVDSLDTFTLVQGGALLDFVDVIPAGWVATDIAIEYNGDGAGGTWTTLVGAGADIAPTPGEQMVVRFREVGTRRLQPVADPADPETEPGQVELLFRIKIR